MTKHHSPRSNTKSKSHPRPHSKQEKPSETKPLVEGVLQMKGKIGFVLSEDPNVGDVLVQGPSLQMALPDDRVRARVTSSPSDPRRSGVIVHVLQRAHTTMTGTFHRQGNRAVVIAEGQQALVQILDLGSFSPKVGDMVVVNVTRWPTATKVAGGTLVEVLGDRNTPGVDLDVVIRRYELPKQFSAEAEQEAVTWGETVPDALWQSPARRTFFDQRVFTIDGADAKDFDDAVSLEPLPNGWRLAVHIADVAEYVREGSTLDIEARKRGTSVYFTGSVLPMLPFPLSDGLCSLKPNCVRLTLSCVMDIDRDGEIFDYRVLESAIRSAKRFTYEQVEQVLRGQELPGLDPLISSDVLKMGELARLLRKKRFARGSLDFDFPEPYISVGENGRPTDIQVRERLEAHRLIEEFMLLANETVARHMQKRPFIYRIHESPDPARLEKLQLSLKMMGIHVPPKADLKKPASLAAFLKSVEGSARQPLIHMLVLRSLKQAVYSPVNKGHYGLASTCYTHFTSPIRRYPDLLVHRMVKEHIHRIDRNAWWAEILPELAAQSSKCERVAVDAEREFLDIQKTRFMESRVGEEFDAVVSSVTNFGLFVQLNDFFVEGLVHVTSLHDYYIFDEHRLTLTGRRNGFVYMMGTKVKVKLVSANVVKHQLDFEIVQEDIFRRRPQQQRFRRRH